MECWTWPEHGKQYRHANVEWNLSSYYSILCSELSVPMHQSSEHSFQALELLKVPFLLRVCWYVWASLITCPIHDYSFPSVELINQRQEIFIQESFKTTHRRLFVDSFLLQTPPREHLVRFPLLVLMRKSRLPSHYVHHVNKSTYPSCRWTLYIIDLL